MFQSMGIKVIYMYLGQIFYISRSRLFIYVSRSNLFIFLGQGYLYVSRSNLFIFLDQGYLYIYIYIYLGYICLFTLVRFVYL